MNVIYLDQNAAIDLAEANSTASRFYRTRQIIFRLVEDKVAIFPYSILHQLESADMSDESKTQLAEFWQTVSRGYRFTEIKNIRTRQFLDLLHGKPMRFRPQLVLFHDRLKFAESLDWPTYSSLRSVRVARFREVIERWSTLRREEINKRVRTDEAETDRDPGENSRFSNGVLGKFFLLLFQFLNSPWRLRCARSPTCLRAS